MFFRTIWEIGEHMSWNLCLAESLYMYIIGKGILMHICWKLEINENKPPCEQFRVYI